MDSKVNVQALSKNGFKSFNDFLVSKNIHLSKRVLNASIKKVLIDKLLNSEDCFELQCDIDKIEKLNNPQLMLYINFNHLVLDPEELLAILWQILVDNATSLGLYSSLFERVDTKTNNKEEFSKCFELLTNFVEETNDFDGVSELDFAISILEKCTTYEIVELFMYYNVETPNVTDRQVFLDRLLDYKNNRSKTNVSQVNFSSITSTHSSKVNDTKTSDTISFANSISKEEEEELKNLINELSDEEDDLSEESEDVNNDEEDSDSYKLDNIINSSLLDEILNDDKEERVERKIDYVDYDNDESSKKETKDLKVVNTTTTNINENEKEKVKKEKKEEQSSNKKSLVADYLIALMFWFLLMALFFYIRFIL